MVQGYNCYVYLGYQKLFAGKNNLVIFVDEKNEKF